MNSLLNHPQHNLYMGTIQIRAVDTEAKAISGMPHTLTPGTSDWNLKCSSSSPLKLKRLHSALRCSTSSIWIFISYTSLFTPNSVTFLAVYFLYPHPSIFSPLTDILKQPLNLQVPSINPSCTCY